MFNRHVRAISLITCLSVFAGCGGGGGDSAAPTPPVNSAPIANNQSIATNPDTDLNGTLTGSDANGDSLTFAIVNMPTSGTLTISGGASQDFLYEPNAGFNGQDTFTFTANDASATSAAATITVNVNATPVATGVSFKTSDIASVDGGVSAIDAENDAVTFAISAQPSKGSVSNFDSAAGTFTYTPNSDQDGVDTFEISASDGFQTSDPAVVSIEIFDWSGTQQFGTPFEDRPTNVGLFQTADGGFILSGWTRGQISNTPLNGAQDGWVRKIDRRGNVVWTTQLGNSDENNARAVMPDPVSGGTFVLVTQLLADEGLIYKLDSDGNEEFSNSIDYLGINVYGTAYHGDIDSNGDLYVLTRVNGDTSLVTKLDGSNGATLWQVVLAGTDESGPLTPFNEEWRNIIVQSVDFDSSGNAVVAGMYYPVAPFTTSDCAPCAFVSRFSPAGVLLSSTELNTFANACGDAAARLHRVTVAPDQSLWAVGDGYGPDPGAGFGQVTRYTADASQAIWTHCGESGAGGAAYFTAVEIASNGDGLVFGSIRGEFAPNGGYESSEIIVTRLDVDGNELFSTGIGTTKVDGSVARVRAGSIVEDSQGILYVTGDTDGEFFPGAALGDFDVMILRLDANGNVQ